MKTLIKKIYRYFSKLFTFNRSYNFVIQKRVTKKVDTNKEIHKHKPTIMTKHRYTHVRHNWKTFYKK